MTAIREMEAKENKGPFHAVNPILPLHTGPFTTYIDAALAVQLANQVSGVRDWVAMDHVQFGEYLRHG
jgi:hypothetical protein